MTEGLAADLNTVSPVKFSPADGADFTTASKNTTEEERLNVSAPCKVSSLTHTSANKRQFRSFDKIC